VYNRHTTDKQSAETAEASHGAEQSGTTTPSSMSTPTSSHGKVTDNSSEEQKRDKQLRRVAVSSHSQVKLAMLLTTCLLTAKLTRILQRIKKCRGKEIEAEVGGDIDGNPTPLYSIYNIQIKGLV
jgi:hypothetical protein